MFAIVMGIVLCTAVALVISAEIDADYEMNM